MKMTRRLRVISILAVIMAGTIAVFPQKVVDKTVAAVSDGLKTELITLSDLRWELALTPGARLTPPSSEDLKVILERLIDQRIWVLEAGRLPRNPVTEKEVADEIKRILDRFPTAGEFEARLREVGFSSVNDANFREIIANRISIEKYLDFRFRSFIVVTAKDEETYYRDVYVPEFRRRYTGVEVPSLSARRGEINEQLVEDRVAVDMQTFLESA
jgi:hypothetical protein